MKRQEGSVILMVLLVSAVFAVLAPVAGTIATSEARIARSHAVQNTALHIAEAGVELAVARLRAEPAFTTPTGNPISGDLNSGSFAVEIISEAPGTGEVARRRIAAIGRWGGGQQRAAARVTFTQTPLQMQSFLFRHTLLSGGTAEIRGSVISGPVRLHALHNNSGGNTFDSDQDLIVNEQEDQPVMGTVYDALIPLVNFSHYQQLAIANRNNPNNSLRWFETTSGDLDGAINAANSLLHQRILVNAGNNNVTLDAPVNFSGLIVIQVSHPKEVDIKANINAGSSQPLVILTTGDIDIGPGLGNSPVTLGDSTLLYSNGTVSITQAEGGKNNPDGGGLRMKGILVAKKGGAKPRDLWNANLAYNNAMLGLLAQDAQPGFFSETSAITMHVEYIRP